MSCPHTADTAEDFMMNTSRAGVLEHVVILKNLQCGGVSFVYIIYGFAYFYFL